MRASELPRAIAAAKRVASATEAVILQNSNKLTLRLPGDILARVAPAEDRSAWFEIDIARQLARTGSPVAAHDPVVHERDGYVITLWTYYPSVGEVSPAGYADALRRLHAGLRRVDPVTPPHFTERVEQARELIADHRRTPALAPAEREFLAESLGRPLRGAEQLLHGEPHPGNVLATADGPLFIDLETCCRGPIEFDLAHGPEEAASHYPGIDRELLRDCRKVTLAIATAWRWDRADQFPDGPRLGVEWLARLRES